MRRRKFITLLGSATAWPLVARAQQAGIPRIGFLGNSTAVLEANLITPFRNGLRALGYEEGRNLAIEYRWAEGKYERFPTLIAELIVGLLDSERLGGGGANGEPMTASELNLAAARFYRQVGCDPVPPAQVVSVTDEQLAQVRATLESLKRRWNSIPRGGAIELDFE